MLPGVEELSQTELLAAVFTGQALWQALEASDDDELAGLLTAGALAYLGAEPGIAERIRVHLQITAEECATLGLISRISILPARELRLTYVLNPSGEIVPWVAGQVFDGWRVELVLDEGRWLVDPIRAHTAAAIGTADIQPG